MPAVIRSVEAAMRLTNLLGGGERGFPRSKPKSPATPEGDAAGARFGKRTAKPDHEPVSAVQLGAPGTYRMPRMMSPPIPE
jgi:hypothetical protein